MAAPESYADKNVAFLNGFFNACLGWFTFYYLGLVLGNKVINKDFSLKRLAVLYLASIVLQMGEGYVWYLFGDANCGTQLKITSLLTSSLFLLIVYTLLKQGKTRIDSKLLRMLGDYSFGIYLCHIMVMMCLSKVPYYGVIPFPINSAIVVALSLACCYMGSRVCGKKISSWLGLK